MEVTTILLAIVGMGLTVAVIAFMSFPLLVLSTGVHSKWGFLLSFLLTFGDSVLESGIMATLLTGLYLHVFWLFLMFSFISFIFVYYTVWKISVHCVLVTLGHTFIIRVAHFIFGLIANNAPIRIGLILFLHLLIILSLMVWLLFRIIWLSPSFSLSFQLSIIVLHPGH